MLIVPSIDFSELSESGEKSHLNNSLISSMNSIG